MKELFITFSIIFISTLIGILLCYFSEKSDEKKEQKQYLKSTSENTSDDSDKQIIYLSLDKIKEFYYLRPEKYKFKYNYSGFYYLNSRGYNIYTKELKEQDEFKKWMQQIERDEKESKQNSSMVEFLEKVVKEDIRHIKRLADEQFQQARKTAEEVSERLKDEEI